MNFKILDNKLDLSLRKTKFGILNRDSLGTDDALMIQYFMTADAKIGSSALFKFQNFFIC